jgi:hypothetical protein
MASLLLFLFIVIVAEFTPPPRPEVFQLVDEFDEYLQHLTEYHRIAGQPRFGRSVMGLNNNEWASSLLLGIMCCNDLKKLGSVLFCDQPCCRDLNSRAERIVCSPAEWCE